MCQARYCKHSWGVGMIFLMIHIAVVIGCCYFSAAQGNRRQPPWGPQQPPGLLPREYCWHNYLDLNRWDSLHYRDIVVNGYQRANDPSQASHLIMWYPGYPLLARLLYLATGWRVTFILSLLSLIFTALFWLLLWSSPFVTRLGVKVLGLASVLMVLWPGSFFWFAGMSEAPIGFLLVLCLYLWFKDQHGWLWVVLGVATFTKQVFVPLALAFWMLEILRHRPQPVIALGKLLLALSGYLAFGSYSYFKFGNFFLPSQLHITTYGKQLTLFSLVDFNHYAQFILTVEGFVAFASMQLLLIESLRIPHFWSNWRQMIIRRPEPVAMREEMVLWWLALAATSFYIFGCAYTRDNPFGSMVRYQAVNLPFFLLLACRFRPVSWWKTALVWLPVGYIWFYWLWRFIVLYWAGHWVS